MRVLLRKSVTDEDKLIGVSSLSEIVPSDGKGRAASNIPIDGNGKNTPPYRRPQKLMNDRNTDLTLSAKFL